MHKDFLAKVMQVYIVTGLMDGAWALYFVFVASHRPILSGITSAILVLMSIFITKKFVEDTKMAIPAALGAFSGTYLIVALDKLKPL